MLIVLFVLLLIPNLSMRKCQFSSIRFSSVFQKPILLKMKYGSFLALGSRLGVHWFMKRGTSAFYNIFSGADSRFMLK